MTSKRQRQAGYLLPEPQTGYPLVCVQLMIPDHPRYRAALRGQLKALGDWWTWEKSFQPGDVRARDAAQLWRELLHEYLTIGECGMTDFDVRQNEETPCVLEKTSDGATWEPWADLQLCPPKIRSLAGRLFVSTNGGATWEPVEDATYEEYDWRDDEVLLPPRTGDNKRCLAAANAVAVFVELHREIVEWYDTEANALKLGMAILGVVALLFPVGALYIAGAIAGTGLALGILEHATALTNASFTQQIQDELRCIFYCWADDNGRWSQGAFSLALSDVQARSGDMWRLLEIYLGEIGGYTGLNNAGTTTSIATANCADCTACNWCYTFDFTASDGGWTEFDWSGATYVHVHTSHGASGWSAGLYQGQAYPINYWRIARILRTFSAATITKIKVDFIFVPGQLDAEAYRVYMSDTETFYIQNISAGASTLTWTGERTMDTLAVQLEVGMSTHSTDPGGTGIITRVTLSGPGTNPFGGNNCT